MAALLQQYGMGCTEHPPYSPDLAPSVFNLLSLQNNHLGVTYSKTVTFIFSVLRKKNIFAVTDSKMLQSAKSCLTVVLFAKPRTLIQEIFLFSPIEHNNIFIMYIIIMIFTKTVTANQAQITNRYINLKHKLLKQLLYT